MSDDGIPRDARTRAGRPPVAPPTLPPDAGARVARARSRLTLGDQVALALRDHRARLGLSQRAYAGMRAWGRSTMARFEGNADGCRLRDVVGALQGTGFDLALVRLPPSPRAPGAASAPADSTHTGLRLAAVDVEPGIMDPDETPQIVDPTTWPVVELVTRRGIGRRCPAHRRTQHVTMAPMWWWVHEYVTSNSDAPDWYAPRLPVPPEAQATRARGLADLDRSGPPADDRDEAHDMRPSLRLISGGAHPLARSRAAG